MSELIEWVRPSGSTIKTNKSTENLKKAKDLGWKAQGGQARAVNSMIKQADTTEETTTGDTVVAPSRRRAIPEG